MKKYLFLLAALGLFLFASCSEDDDEAIETSIVGTWQVTAIESIAPVDPNQCDNQMSTITFNEDNTLNSTFYFQQNDCQASSATGTWENLGDGQYAIDLGLLGESEGTVAFGSSNKFTYTTELMIEGIAIPATFTLERQ
ncbi:lipocalin family protein [Salinimicrobium terrae]|uniref:lipocalin family protein n=1 Tax=Salinimicrobium terrae TaxID=470866 RepID=UPI00041A8E63|nr:lipocalin family protein [Salinimicrobium terrae]